MVPIRFVASLLLAVAAVAGSTGLRLDDQSVGVVLAGRNLSIWKEGTPREASDWAELPESGFRSVDESGAWTGYRPGSILLRLRVVAPEAGVWWIREDYPDVDSLRAEANGKATCWIGEDVPRSRWCTPWHGLWLPIDLDSGENLVHLEIVERTGRLGLSVQMEPDGIRHARAEDDALRDGLLVGLLLANLVLAGFLLALVRHPAHLWYLVYQAMVILFVFGSRQHAYAWLWPDRPALNQITPSLGSIGAFGALSLFLVHLLDLREHFPRLGTFFRAQGILLMFLCVLQVLIPVAPWVVDLCYSGPQIEVLEISSYLLGMVLVGWLAIRGNRRAISTAFAMVPMVVALGLSLGGEILHTPWLYSHRGVILEFSMCLENLALSILLIRRVGEERREHARLLAEHLALETSFVDRLVQVTDRHLKGTALDLHDGIGQDLAALRIQAERIARSPGGSPEGERLERELARVALAVRDTAHGLYPPELQGGNVREALDLLSDRLRENRSLDLVVEGRLDPRDEDAALHWYRIAQEAIQNAQKHGRATRVVIWLHGDRMVVEDDGVGIPGDLEEGAGLRTIRTRASRMSCEVVRGTGTRGGCRIEIRPVGA